MSGSDICKFWVVFIKIKLLARTLPPTPSLLAGKPYSSVLGTRHGSHILRMGEPSGRPVIQNNLRKLPTFPRLLSHSQSVRDTQSCSSKLTVLGLRDSSYLCLNSSRVSWSARLWTEVWLPFHLFCSRRVTPSLQ